MHTATINSHPAVSRKDSPPGVLLFVIMSFNHTAGVFLPCILNRLGVKVIRVTVNKYTMFKNIIHNKSIRIYRQVCIPLAPQHRNLRLNQYTTFLIKPNLQCLCPTYNPHHRIWTFSVILYSFTSYQLITTLGFCHIFYYNLIVYSKII